MQSFYKQSCIQSINISMILKKGKVTKCDNLLVTGQWNTVLWPLYVYLSEHFRLGGNNK